MRARRTSETLDLLRLAMPIIGMTVSRMAMGFIDFWMVSQLGTEAQAAISPATVFVFALACLGMGAAQSIQTFVSQADGRGEPWRGGSYAWQSFYLALLCGLLTLPVAWTTPGWLGSFAGWAGHAPGVARLEIDYVQIALWSVAPATVCAGLNGFFMGIQRARVGLFAVLISLVVNVFGNWVLIYGNLGFPAMGVAGAAIATVIGWCARAVVLTAMFLLPGFDARFRTRRTWQPSLEKLAGIARVGGPTSVQWLIDIGAWVVFMSVIIPPYGTVAMAASNIGLQLMHLSFMPAVGIGIALCTKVGFVIGEGRPDEALRKAARAMRLTGGYMGLIGLLFVLAPGPLLHAFTHDPEVVRLGRQVLIWAAIFQIFDAMGITYMNALRGAGDTRIPAIIVGFCCWVIFIGGGLLCARLLPDLGIHGPWACCTLYITLLGLLLLLRFRSGVWRRIRLFETRTGPGTAPQPAASVAAGAGGE